MSRIRHLISFLFSTAFLLCAGLTPVSAQDNLKNISLDEAIAAALDSNKTLRLAKLDENISGANYKQTQAVYLPQLNFSYTAISTNNPLNAFGFKLEQKSITAADFNPDLLNHPPGTPDFTAKLELQQPLVNMDMMFMRKAAEQQTVLYKYKTQRTKEYLAFEVQKAYLQLQLAYDAVEVLQDALQTEKAVYKFTDDHFKQGLIQKSDVLNVQVQVATVETNLERAESNIQNTSDYLSVLMGRPTGVIYSINRSREIVSSTADTVSFIPPSRSDFAAMEKAIEAKNLMIRSGKMGYLPRLNAFGSYQLTDSRMLGFGAHAYLVGLQLEWVIFKGNKTKNSVALQTFERNQLRVQLSLQQEQSNLELSKTKRDISDAQFEIDQHRVAIEQAAESLRILQNRYLQGLVNTTDIMMATSQLSQQKLALVQAVFNQQVSKAYMQFLTASGNK